jgi:hypothetical protein
VYFVFVIARFLSIFPKNKCPQCNAELPKHRKPANIGQALGGKWSCPECGCKLPAPEAKPKK